MRRFGKYGSRLRLRAPLAAVPVGVAGVFLFSAASLADDPVIEPAGSVNNYSWSPSSAAVSAGGAVTFNNPSGSVLHGVTWTSGPEKPSCSGVPIDDGKTGWSGSCRFAQAGSYGFYCSVHPTEMKGTITVSSAGAPPPGSPPPSGSPVTGAVASDLKLARKQRGSKVRGSIQLLRVGPGSSLKVDLLASRRHLLGPGHSGKMRAGRLARSSPGSGRFPFAVSLSRVAHGALLDGQALPLTVTVTVTSPDGEVFKRIRGVLMGNGAAPVRQAR